MCLGFTPNPSCIAVYLSRTIFISFLLDKVDKCHFHGIGLGIERSRVCRLLNGLFQALRFTPAVFFSFVAKGPGPCTCQP
jgi:hypothetical protein